MHLNRDVFFQKLQDSYEYYYNVIEQEPTEEVPLLLEADFHARDEGYVLIKRAKIWSAESNEYVYVFSAPSIDRETAARCLDLALERGNAQIVPHKEHKSSYIIAVFVADVIDPAAEREICSRSYDISHKRGLYGWTTLKTVAVALEGEWIKTNKAGKNLKPFYKKLLRSEKV